MKALTSLEVCAGAGGQALGLEAAGFDHVCLVENDRHACETLRANRPKWEVREADLREFSAVSYRGQARLVAGGVPCPPFSVAGKQLGADDERDLMPHIVRLAEEVQSHAVLIENVRGILDARFDGYRETLRSAFEAMEYEVFDWRLFQASDFGVPQLRPRALFVAIKQPWADYFTWPDEADQRTPLTVGEVLEDLMREAGWEGAEAWARGADRIAPTLVGGSKKHGGPDLGPTRAKRAWAELGVDGMGISDTPPAIGFSGPPKLTVRMTARLQGFPDSWTITGRKTNAYRQVGNALPPPVAAAIGGRIADALRKGDEAAASA